MYNGVMRNDENQVNDSSEMLKFSSLQLLHILSPNPSVYVVPEEPHHLPLLVSN